MVRRLQSCLGCITLSVCGISSGLLLQQPDEEPEAPRRMPILTRLNAAQCAHAAGMDLDVEGEWGACNDAEFSLQSQGADLDAGVMCWDGTKEPRQQNTIYLMHIPKTAICSLIRDVSKMVGRDQVWTNEKCYSARERPLIGSVMTMLRHPRTHVISQYYHCKGSTDYPVLWARVAMPRSFGAWVQAWETKLRKGTANGTWPYYKDQFGCCRPIDMQSQRFTCAGAFDYPAEVDVNAAVKNMLATEYVGIMEAYQESVCLFHAKILGTVPQYCDCTSTARWSSFSQKQIRHGVHYDRKAIASSEVWRKVDGLTRADHVLYRAAVKRFLREVREVEQQHGVHIMCNKTLLDK